VKASGTAELGKKDADTVRYELAPPQETLIASGTLQRSRAVYFKLRPAAQVTLEGAKEFTLVLRTPHGWRADSLHVRCQAIRRIRTMLSGRDQQTTAGGGEFAVALYAAGDEEAKALAGEFVAADGRLRRAVTAYMRQDRGRRDISLLRQLTVWMDPSASASVPPEVRALLSDVSRPVPTALDQLPRELRAPATEVLAVRQRFDALRDGTTKK
jgi:hypothetical protein